jgi:drug/metabolite transporter (DMT)-like permease
LWLPTIGNNVGRHILIANIYVVIVCSIYQSSSAFVFILSVVMLRESVTATKVIAVVICLAGVITICFAPSTGSASSVHETAAGYFWVIASTAAYR